MIETHGKIDSTQPTSLDQVWGYNALAQFGTTDEADYQKQLDDMLRIDLETHARRQGVMVCESTARLREKLLNNFRSFVALLNKPADAKKTTMTPDQATLKVLAEGR